MKKIISFFILFLLCYYSNGQSFTINDTESHWDYVDISIKWENIYDSLLNKKQYYIYRINKTLKQGISFKTVEDALPLIIEASRCDGEIEFMNKYIFTYRKK